MTETANLYISHIHLMVPVEDREVIICTEGHNQIRRGSSHGLEMAQLWAGGLDRGFSFQPNRPDS